MTLPAPRLPGTMKVRIPLAVAVAATALAGSAAAQNRMWIGFHDDPVLRYGDLRQHELDRVRASNATVVRTLLNWRATAPTRPARAADPFSPAYRFDDVDEFVRNAQVRGMEVLITIWGTPKWANGGKGPQFLSRRMADFQAFARAVATRYSGRFAGYPFVRFFGIWNESNLGNFLSPQFNAKGQIVSPAAYAKLAAAGYAGLKAGSARALVAIGETSSNGRDRKKKGATDSVAPATFARLLAKANRRLRFDAWAQHPYPVPVNQPPTQKVRYPNVNLSTLPRFERDLDTWFGRRNTPVWITEYGHETKPGEPKGVTEGQQAVYITRAIAIARADPRVPMFVWFVFRDSPGSTWQSGIYRTGGAPKPGRATWAASARRVDIVNGRVAVKAGTRNPVVRVYLRELCATVPVGAPVSGLARTTLSGRIVQGSLLRAPLAIDCTIAVRLVGLTVAKRKTYTARIQVTTPTSATVVRTLQLVAT